MSKITLMLKLFRDETGQIRPTQAVSQATKKHSVQLQKSSRPFDCQIYTK